MSADRNINLKWTHRPLKLTTAQVEILEREISHISDELELVEDLIFHTVFLTEDRNGAIVIVEGKPGYSNTLFLTYYETPEWVTL